MATRPFHLAWFLSQGYGPKGWRGDWSGADVARWMMPDLFIDLAQGMERACFDYLIIEDSSNVPYTYKGSHDTYLKYGASAPKLDPAELVPYLAQATNHLGLRRPFSVRSIPPSRLAGPSAPPVTPPEGPLGRTRVPAHNSAPPRPSSSA